MGLDMYLNAERFYWSKDGGPKLDDVPEGYSVNLVKSEVAYWRKANAIHQWFVDNVQGGEDDCRSRHVTRDELKALVDICKRVIAEPDKAKDLLPTANGFFFGGTDYEEYYFQYLEDTVEQVEKALSKFPDDWEFEYHSSW
jgi:hypothetical protein